MYLRIGLFILAYLILLFARHWTAPKVRSYIFMFICLALYACFGPWNLAVLALSIGMNYVMGIRLRKTESGALLAMGVVLNVGLLSFFKYLPQAAQSLPGVFPEPIARFLMPVGLSFWTFQAISYLFDQYRGEDLDPTLPEFATYMGCMLTFLSGPICRLTDMLPQYRSEEPMRWDDFWVGMRRVARGVFMMQVAKLLGLGILGGGGLTHGFDEMTQWSGSDVWILAIGYGLQLYLDFAGYVNIMLGLGRGLGLQLPENFDRPWESCSPSQFWTKWHMSLSFWIRDYVFLPLASIWRDLWWRYLMLFTSMVIFGLWHKATWLFLLWGAYHGALLVLHRLIQMAEKKWNLDMDAPIWTPISWAVTILLVDLGWIFFGAHNLAQASAMWTALVGLGSYQSHYVSSSFYALVGIVILGQLATNVVLQALSHAANAGEEEAVNPLLRTLARYQWYWVPGFYFTVLAIIAILAESPLTNKAEIMYRAF